jgi:formamidopyrimidine-DNA glycosylase
VPELPEVESARAVVERSALGREIVAVDDSDTWVCRPHAPGDLALALIGRSLTAAHRRGKSMWCETGDDGPVLGIHLGMSGKIVIASADGTEVDGGDHWEFGRLPGDYRFSRFSLRFADDTTMRLLDPRRLGRVRLDPPVDVLGPDAATITDEQLAAAIQRGHAPVKARLLDQHALAGIGNLLADEILWRAGIHPARTVDTVTDTDLTTLQRAVHDAVRDALHDGGVHTLTLVPHRTPGGHCPTDGAELGRTKVGGRTSYWCPVGQPA